MPTMKTMLLAATSLLLLLPGPASAESPATFASNVRQTIAHRGASAERPENTLSALRRAIRVGATATEVDVRTSSDNELVLLHDDTLDRTTSGTGPISAVSLKQLRQLDAGSWFDSRYRHQTVPTLREALVVCRGRIDILLDLKGTGEEYVNKVMGEVEKYGDPGRTIIGVRSVEQARMFRSRLPQARQLGLIPDTDAIEPFIDAGVETIRLWPKWLSDTSLVTRVADGGAALHLNGTDGSKQEVLELLQYGPASLSSDDPHRLVRTLRSLSRHPAQKTD
jgi:glycerophosphoryl diester phosphodiesterase